MVDVEAGAGGARARTIPIVKIVLNGDSPAEAAKALVEAPSWPTSAVRKSLLEGGETAVAKSDDPLIVLARQLEPILRETDRR